MSTHSEELGILVRLKEVRQFLSQVRELARGVDHVGDEAQQTGDQMATAARKTSRFERANRTMHKASLLGAGGIKRLAGAVVGLVAAYASFHGIKTAVEATTDMAKATAGLHRNLGIATDDASSFLGVLESRGVAPTKATVAITKLSRAYTQAVAGSKSALASFQAIGVTQQDLIATGGDFNKLMQITGDGFGKTAGSAQRQAAAQGLLGRGYSALLPLFSSGSKGLQEQIDLAHKYGVAIGDGATDQVMELVQGERELKLAQLGVRIQIGRSMIPIMLAFHEVVLKTAVGFNALTQRVRKVLPIMRDFLSRGDFTGAGAALSQAITGSDDLAGSFSTLFSVAASVGTIFKDSLVPAVGDFTTFMNNLPGVFRPVTSLLQTAADHTDVLKVAFIALIATWVLWKTTMLAVVAVEKISAFMMAWNTKETILQTTAQRIAAAATKVWIGMQWLLNAAMEANPLILITTLIIALAAAIIIAWKRSSTFRGIVLGTWAAIKGGVETAVNFVIAKWNAFTSFFSKLPGRMKRIGGAIGTGIKNGVVEGLRQLGYVLMETLIGPINAAISAINDTVGRVPGVPNIPEIQNPFASGGGSATGAAQVGSSTAAAPAPARSVSPGNHGGFTQDEITPVVSAGSLVPTVVVPVSIDGREVARAVGRAKANKEARK